MKRVALSAIATLLVLGASSLALADNDHDHDPGSHERRAPEPMTIIGLAAGAVGIGAARWAIQRSKRKP